MGRIPLSALTWAREAGGTTVFGWLEVGDTFRFPGTAFTNPVYTKVKGGWFTDATGKRFRTGARTAVVVLTAASPHATG